MTARWEHASLWSGSLPPREAAAPPSGREWEVVVVGAGLTGLVTAVVLTRAGHEVLVVERHGIGGVTTRGSTGKLSALQGDMLWQITQQRGAEAAATYARSALRGVAGLRGLIAELAIDCSLQDAADHTYATQPEGAEQCRRILSAASQAGLPVEWVDDTDLPFPVTGVVRLEGQAHLDPGALCAGLAATLPAGTVLEGVPVVSVAEDADGVTVELATGPALRAQHAVIATLGPIHDPMFLSTRCEPRRSYAIAVPLDAPVAGTYISVDDEPRSIRPARIGDQPAIVVGGAGHIVGELGGRSARDRWNDLERFATEAFGCGPATHRWAAHDLVPSDHVPFIGLVAPGARRRWVASGFQKWGISTSFAAAALIADGIEGRTGDEAALFDPRRLASTVTTRLLHDGVRAARHLVLDKLDDLVHRAPARPRCSHLGCVLAYDADEATWDCPCHGSRYDAEGQVIAGPAVTAVTPRRVRMS